MFKGESRLYKSHLSKMQYGQKMKKGKMKISAFAMTEWDRFRKIT
jgi:hypothetical protein